jgi:hypothetical protein
MGLDQGAISTRPVRHDRLRRACPSARSPRTELVGVAYDPDALDPVAGDIEREYRHDCAVLLSHQAGLAVDRALEKRRVAGRAVGEFDPSARDLFVAFDGVQEGQGEAAAVGGRCGIGVEQADEGIDVLGLPGPLEVTDDLGALGDRSRWSLRGTKATAGRRGQLATGRRGTADDLGHHGEGVPEDVVQDERHALGWRHRFEHDEEGHVHRLVEGDSVRRVAGTFGPSGNRVR